MHPRNVIAVALFLAVVGLIGCSKKEPEPASATRSTPAADSAQPAGEEAGDDTGEELGTGDALDLAAEYEKQCAGKPSGSRDCAILRSLLVVEVTFALEEIERARDQRGTEEALAALDLTREPEILIAACRVLGQFPNTPGIAEKALPLVLTNPYIGVQQAAAHLLSLNSDENVADVGRLWSQNHTQLPVQDEFQEYPDFPRHYAAMNFPDYPGAEWFSPGDSHQSVGWTTPDDAATVAAWLGKATKSEPLTAQQWFERQVAQLTQAYKAMDQTKLDRITKLTEQYMKTQDPALIEQVEKLQKEMSAPMEAAQKVSEASMDNVARPGMSSPNEDIRYFIAEEKAGHVARAILVYRLPALDRTVVQTSWNLGDYPSAWPQDDTSL